MKKATSETRIRLHIDLCLGAGDHPENITMTAAAWDAISSAYVETAIRLNQLDMHAIADRHREISNEIYKALEFRGYYD